MNISKLIVGPLFTLILAAQASAQSIRNQDPRALKPALAPAMDLKRLNIPFVMADPVSQVAFTYLNPASELRLQQLAHTQGRCGGFEALPIEVNPDVYRKHLEQLQSIFLKNRAWSKVPWRPIQRQMAKPEISEALSQIDENNIRDTVVFLSSFKNRYEKNPDGSAHLYKMKTKIEGWLRTRQGRWSVDIISHKSTPQKSLRVRLVGAKRPNEIIVLGGHHDSINLQWGSNHDIAPGADDNASGSANLLEILRILALRPALDRTVEVIWYGGEESGLLGSAEIAKAYKAANADVVGVVQMDMTLYPGSGEMTISNIADYTHPWLQALMKQLNEMYVGARIVDDTCGYGCSDHASWNRQGFPTVLPFESKMAQMNPNIHTVNDILTPKMSFKHAAAIAKLSLAIAMELGSSDIRPPR